MAPNSIGAFLFKHRKRKTLKDPEPCNDSFQKNSQHDARDPKVMISFASQQFKHLSERDVSKI